MGFELNHHIAGLSLAWLGTGIITSAAVGIAGYRSTARSRHAFVDLYDAEGRPLSPP
jgi:hypothetical protein